MADATEVVLFDDGIDLSPLTDLRASFEVRTGALTVAERISAQWRDASIVGVHAPGAIAAVVADRPRPVAPVNEPIRAAAPLLINGRITIPDRSWRALEPGHAIATPEGVVVAARLDAETAGSFLTTGRLPRGVACEHGEAAMIDRPWDVIRCRDDTLDHDLGLLIGSGDTLGHPECTTVGDGAVRVEPGATVMPGAVLDTTDGPIVIGEGAVIRPNAVVAGPAFIGRGSTVLDGAVIRPHTAIGPRCKVNGEVSGTTFQGLANKAHDGFVGDSWIGSWVNLGAGTVTSNLLNTYGEVLAQRSPGDRRERTGLTFLGSIIGDHAKTAIGTRLMTGSVIGTGAMISLSGHAPPSVPNFAWLTDDRTIIYRLPKFMAVADAVMARRDRRMGAAEADRLRALHDAETRHLVAPPIDYQI